jgi:hypothetical protein
VSVGSVSRFRRAKLGRETGLLWKYFQFGAEALTLFCGRPRYEKFEFLFPECIRPFGSDESRYLLNLLHRVGIIHSLEVRIVCNSEDDTIGERESRSWAANLEPGPDRVLHFCVVLDDRSVGARTDRIWFIVQTVTVNVCVRRGSPRRTYSKSSRYIFPPG